jgi:uncharacterized repeat protein (TIGR01451 family)
MTTLGLLLAAHAAAQVTLSNSVKKVETVLNESGEAERRLVDALSVVPGDELRYTITFTNEGGEVVDAGSIVITNPIPEATEYLDGTAFGSGTDIVFSTDGVSFASANELMVDEAGVEAPASARDYTIIRWVFSPELEPGETGNVSFNVRLK